MNNLSSIARSGMQAAQTQLDAAASNVANAQTPAYRRREVVQQERSDGGVSTDIRRTPTEGVALETDLVAQLQAKNAFLANLQVFKTGNAMAGALLDQKA